MSTLPEKLTCDELIQSFEGNLIVSGDTYVTEGKKVTLTNISTIDFGSTTFVSYTVPEGGIIMWYGNLLQDGVPYGWLLCDGTSNTPNLSGKFIVGSDTTYKFEGLLEGGSETQTLIVDNLPAHTHSNSTSNSGRHSHNGFTNNGNLDGVHNHRFPLGTLDDSNFTSSNNQKPPGDSSNTIEKTYTIGTIGSGHRHVIETEAPHTHNFITTPASRETTPFSIIPKYYALVYIMKKYN